MDLRVIPAQVHGPPRPGSYPRSCCAHEEGEAQRPRCRAGEGRRARQAACVWRLRSRPQGRAHAHAALVPWRIVRCRARAAVCAAAHAEGRPAGTASRERRGRARSRRWAAWLLRGKGRCCGRTDASHELLDRHTSSESLLTRAGRAQRGRATAFPTGLARRRRRQPSHGFGEARARGPRRRAGWRRARRAVTVTLTPERLPRPQRSDNAERPAGSAAGLQVAAGPSSGSGRVGLGRVKIAGGGRGEEGRPGA